MRWETSVESVHWSDRIPFSRLQYELVRFMLDEGRPVSKEDIGWGIYGHAFTDMQVYNLVRHTRRRMEAHDAPAEIETVARWRYALVEV